MPQSAQNRVNNNKQDRLLTMDPVRCAQLNTHHCKAAMAHLSLYTSENKVDTLFVQELYCYNGGPCYIPPDYLSFHAFSDTNPRAALLIRQEMAHPLTVATRLKTTELRNSTSITFHWVKGHAGLKGNEGRLLG